MKITNSISGRKENFVPIQNKKLKMYACGITVYDLSHIGHARQAIVYAMIADYFRYKGYEVKYVRNYTDVDDKIIKRANESGMNALEFSKMQIDETEKDMQELHVKNADIQTKASEYIPQIIKFIENLIKKGYAYPTPSGDVYFSVKAFSEYGKLSHRNIEELLNGVRIEVGEEKKELVDFALWKAAKANEIFWESPWGKGRPGWHIECSAMVLDTLGETIDIHGGGKDLLFPHHENEIAQSEALTGKRLANYWAHCGLIKVNGEKMSKSLGNSLTIRDVLKQYNYEVVKYLMLSKHYTSDIDITDSDFKLAESHIYYFYNTIKKMELLIQQNSDKNNDKILEDEIPNTIISKFVDAMDDDFNTVISIANLHVIFKYANNIMKNNRKEELSTIANTLEKILADIKEVYSILGLFEQQPDKIIDIIREKYLNKLNIDTIHIESQISERMEAKKIRDFEKADNIRVKLEQEGIILKDTKDGTEWDIKELYNNQ